MQEKLLSLKRRLLFGGMMEEGNVGALRQVNVAMDMRGSRARRTSKGSCLAFYTILVSDACIPYGCLPSIKVKVETIILSI